MVRGPEPVTRLHWRMLSRGEERAGLALYCGNRVGEDMTSIKVKKTTINIIITLYPPVRYMDNNTCSFYVLVKVKT